VPPCQYSSLRFDSVLAKYANTFDIEMPESNIIARGFAHVSLSVIPMALELRVQRGRSKQLTHKSKIS